MNPPTKTERILIWGKTYPELSQRYFETVCTAGVTEFGQPVRLYPIPYRYLTETFEKYQWITADISKSSNDSRPESYRIDCDSIVCGEKIPTTVDEWGKRAEVVFQCQDWQFASVEALLRAQRTRGTSIGVVAPREILEIQVVPRHDDEAKSFEAKFQRIRKALDAKHNQLTLFEMEQSIPREMKQLQFIRARFQITWLCGNPDCRSHKMQVLDWEVCELQRKHGDEQALQKLRKITDIARYDVRFFLGNLFLHPRNFMIAGLWYPRRADLLFR
jgi:hypothetical protein